MFDTFAKNTLVPLILRAGLAVIFVFHGLGKVNAETEWGWSWQKEMPGGPEVMAGPLQMAVGWGELVGGIALGLGLLTRLAALGIAAIMVGAIATVHWPKFSLQEDGFEYNFAILAMCAAVVLGGPGKLAMDSVFFRKRSS
jgi:putative oxidoreductase